MKMLDYQDSFTPPMGYLNLGENGEILDINPAAADFFSIDTIKNVRFSNLLLSKDIPRFRRLLAKGKIQLKPLSDEFTLKSTSKGNITVYLTSVPFKQNDKLSFKILFDPVKEKKILHHILYESEKRFRLMADNSPVMIWMTNTSNELQYMNRTKLEFLGKSMEELTGDGWIMTRHPDDREKFLKALLDAAKEKRNFSIEIRVMDKDGKYRWLLDSAASRILDDNTFGGFIGSGVDITDEKNFRIYLQKSLKEKEVLLTEIHHRVKNNLQIISSLLSIQEAAIDDEHLNALFRTSRDRIRSMAILHEKLYQSENINSVNLKAYLNDLLGYLLMSYRQSSDFELKISVADIDVEIGLCLNIGLILNELVSNSLKHAFKGQRKGEICVDAFTVDHKLRIIVKDNGIGMPHNFDVEKSKSVGLMLVKTLTSQHNGTMEISADGKTFIIDLELPAEQQDIQEKLTNNSDIREIESMFQ